MHAALLILSLALSPPALASAKSDLTSGVVAFNSQDYDRAVESLRSSLAGGLKEKDVPKASLYLARALLAQLAAAQQSGQAPDAGVPVEAAEALIRAREADSSGRWAEQIDAEADRLHGVLLMGALELSNAQQYDAALPYADAAARLHPERHICWDLLGQIRLGLEKSEEARQAWERALGIVEQSPPDRPDMLTAYIAYRLSMMRYGAGEMGEALALIERGAALLEREWGRAETLDAEQQQQHDKIARELGDFRLQILINSPELRQQALAELEVATEAEPDSFAKAVAYASLLEQVDAQKAIAAYERAIAIDGGQAVAHFNLAALHVNRAAALTMRSSEVASYEEAAELLEQAFREQLRAKPRLERALALEPDNLEAVRALMQIAIQEDDMDAYQRLKAERDRIQGL